MKKERGDSGLRRRMGRDKEWSHLPQTHTLRTPVPHMVSTHHPCAHAPIRKVLRAASSAHLRRSPRHCGKLETQRWPSQTSR